MVLEVVRVNQDIIKVANAENVQELSKVDINEALV